LHTFQHILPYTPQIRLPIIRNVCRGAARSGTGCPEHAETAGGHAAVKESTL